MRNFKRWLLLVSIAVAMGAVVFDFGPAASSQNRKSARGKDIAPTSRPGLENYDIRRSRASAPEDVDNIAIKQKGSQLAVSAQKQVVATQSQREAAASVRQAMSTAEAQLASRVPNLKVEYNEALSVPEIVQVEGAGALSASAAAASSKESTLRGFVTQNAGLYGLTRSQASQLKKVSDYTNPSGNLSFVELEQEINGIPVFQGYVRGILTPDGRLMRTTGLLAAGLHAERLDSTPGLGAAEAVAAGIRSINVKVDASNLSVIGTDDQGKQIVSRGPLDDETKTSLVYFPVVPGHAVLAYSMVLWQPDYAYYTIVDANTGALLWRKNITQDQSQAFTYNVYNDDSPTPISPNNAPPQTISPPVPQPPGITRTNITLVSEHEADLLGWIPDSAGPNAPTTGNNVDAGLDIVAPNGIDEPSAANPSQANGRSFATNRVFNFVYKPDGSADPAGSNNPTDPEYRKGAVVNLFFWTNRFHDKLYDLGFTEAARNFQQDNFGRGGAPNDRVLAEAQDSSGTNNANFNTPPDGQSGRMQMYIFTGTPNRDGDLDQDVIIHELTHGVSNRLHANASGLQTDMAGGMGEGWGDFYGLSINSVIGKTDTDGHGLFPAGAYDTRDYYRGIRRFPYTIKASLGPNGKSHNPLTFADIDPAQINFDDAAFPVGTGSANEVHNQGEVWATALWEVRAKLVDKYGMASGNNRMLQLTTDGMKLDPANPTQLNGRDSILAADCAAAFGVDELEIWEGFRIRGMGFRASTAGIHVVESFDKPNLRLGTVNAVEQTGDSDGVVEPGETVRLTIPLTNILCAHNADNATATVTGGANTANYGTVEAGTTDSQTIDYTVPTTTACGAAIPLTITVNSTLGPITYTYFLNVGQPSALTPFENFDGVTPPALPAGWTTQRTGAGIPWQTNSAKSDTPPNSAFTTNPTNAGTSELISPAFPVNTGQARVSFRNLYNLEDNFDGMQLYIKIGGGAFQEITQAGGSFVSGGYNGQITDGNAWTGVSAGTTADPQFITSVVNLPPAANGQIVQLSWRVIADANTIAPGQSGARIDTVKLATTAQTCSRFGVSTVSISGRVTNSAAQGVAGIQVTLSGTTTATATTDINGNYSFPNLVAGGNYTVTPTTPGFDYTPPSRTYNNLNTDVTDANFSLLAQASISGRVTTENGAAGIDGITITLTGTESRTTVTSGGGFYSFPNLTRGGNYTVTPSGGSNNTFTPPSRTYNNLQGPVTDANFTARENLACQAIGTPVNGQIAPGDPTQTQRVFRGGTPSDCNNRPFPGVNADPSPVLRRFDQYTYVNSSASPACIRVTFTANNAGIHSVAYLGAYNPANISQNYLGDYGAAYVANTFASYSFTVPAGATYVIVFHEITPNTPATIDYTFSQCNLGSAPPSPTPTPRVAQPGEVLISEFRQSGVVAAPPASPSPTPTTTNVNDEYVELYNNTDATISISGFALRRGPNDSLLTLPAGTTIPRRGHILVGNSNTSPTASGYSLSAYAPLNLSLSFNDLFPNNQGIALVDNTFNVTIDSVGFVGNGGSWPYIEGNGLPRTAATRPNVQHAYVRKINLATSFPQDTGDNASDFVLVAVDNVPFPGPTASSTVPTILGAPGPENTASPIERNQFERLSLVDPTMGPASGENRKRLGCGAPDTPPCDPNKSAFGFLSIRRKITNNTGASVTRLRFRVVDITTLGSPGDGPGQADLRALTSTTISNVMINGQPTTIEGTTLEEPPNQPRGGGLNSSLRVPTVQFGTPLLNGQSMNVQFLFGVMRDGAFRFIVNIEALP
ncbi:MAG TPA: M36 family metallopeptidase [Pyrinomonadaceae bacterium]|nr:M36 family metallopeptidase [Pyrinomonadaceae bacterium]